MMAASDILGLLLKLTPQLSSSLLKSKVRDVTNGETELRLNGDDLKWLGLKVGAAIDQLPDEGTSSSSTSSSHLRLCLLLGMAGSFSQVQRLSIAGLPEGTSLESGEEAVQVLFGALQSQGGASSLRQLTLVGHEAFGTEKVCRFLGELLRSEDCKLDALTLDKTTRVRADGVKHIAQALEGNKSVRTLKLVGCEVEDEGIEHLAAMLRRNRAIEDLSLHDVGLTGDGVGHLCEAMCEAACAPLKRLKLHENKRIGRGGARDLGNMLAHNRCLEKLIVTSCELEDEEGRLAEGLRNNSTLKELNLDDNRIGRTGLEPLFGSLAERTASLESLDIGRDAGELPGAQELAAMLACNQSLQHLDLTGARYSSAEWVSVIIPAVAENQKLRSISMVQCPGIDVDGVLPALLELLRSNLVLQEIHMDETPLESSGKAEAVFKDLRVNKQFRAALSVVRTAKPNSCRIVLCGKEYAGKSTLFKTMKRLQEDPGSCWHQLKLKGQKVVQTNLRPLFRDSARGKDLSGRTRGIEMHLLRKEDPRISVWDFAGHREFHGLQDFIFPSTNNAATLFVITLSPILSPLEDKTGKEKAPEAMKDELLYWLKFIASNSQASSSHTARPWVVVVITNKDKLSASMLRRLQIWANDTLVQLSKTFEGLLTVWSRLYILNAMMDDDVKGFAQDIQREFKVKLRDLPPEPVLCEQVAKALGGYQSSPIISTGDFADLCMSIANGFKDPEIRASSRAFLESGEKGWRAVASYLNNTGEVMYYEQLKFIVRNPTWFGHGILGHLIDMFSDSPQADRDVLHPCFKKARPRRTAGYLPKDGYISRKSLRELLVNALQCAGFHDPHTVRPDDLIELMLLQDLCYEWKKVDLTETGYLLPAIFEDEEDRAANGKRQLGWTEVLCSTWRQHIIFLGRRLICADTSRTFLTPGFFPRLQVVLRNHGPWVTDNSTCTLEKNLVRIMYNGMEILLEYSGFSGYFVDILVKSSQSHEETLNFVHTHIVGPIRKFCASHEGCQGVTLTEAIIRPDCVRGGEPTLCAYRKTQSVPVEDLMHRMESEPSYRHSWAEVRDEGGNVVLRAGEHAAQFLLTGFQVEELYFPSYDDIMEGMGRQIFVTREDVGHLRAMVSRIAIGRVVPLNLHLKCGMGQSQHVVEGQRGRTFYVVDERFAMDQNLRNFLMRFAAVAVSVGAAAVPGLGAVDLVSLLPQFGTTPVYTDTIETISKRINKTPATISDEELRIEVEKDLKSSAGCAWMVACLSAESDERAFRDDFGLRKVEESYRSPSWSGPIWSGPITVQALVCDRHWTLGRNNRSYKAK